MKTLNLGAAALLASLMLTGLTLRAASQDPMMPGASPAQTAFEGGQYDQTLQQIADLRAGNTAGLAEAFLAAQALIKQSQNDRAKEELSQLTASSDEVWRLIGQSAVAAVDNNLDAALQAADQAVNLVTAQAGAAVGAPQDPGVRQRDFHAFYQQGLVKARREDWGGALPAFERAAQLNPAFAYAHYYAGMSASRVQRPDLVGVHLEQFLKLAPNAPEQAAVMSIMRTLRGA